MTWASPVARRWKDGVVPPNLMSAKSEALRHPCEQGIKVLQPPRNPCEWSLYKLRRVRSLQVTWSFTGLHLQLFRDLMYNTDLCFVFDNGVFVYTQLTS
jgi:hypothetical protein